MEGVLRGVDPMVLYVIVGAVVVCVIGLIVVTGIVDSRRGKESDPGEDSSDT